MANLKKQTFPVLNMHCAGCANNVEKTVRKLVGITDASVNFASNTLSVSYETDKLTPGEIRAAVLAAGYDLIIEEDHAEERQEEEQQKRYRRLKGRVIGAWLFAIPLLLLSMVFMHVPYLTKYRWYWLFQYWCCSVHRSIPVPGNRLVWDAVTWIPWLH